MARNHCSECGRHGHSARRCGEKVAGQPFGKWFAIAPLDRLGNLWLCLCACGTEGEVLRRSLVTGRSLSCGCRQRGPGWQAKFAVPTDRIS